MLFMSFVSSMDRVSLGQLLIDKSCTHDFNFTEQICDNIFNTTFEHEKSQIENEVAQYKVKDVGLELFENNVQNNLNHSIIRFCLNRCMKV